MLDSINIGMTGMLGYSKGLRVISNNTANLNTPGYKGSRLQFTDLFYANNPSAGGTQEQLGFGLDTAGTTIDFQQGDLQATGNEHDLAVQGEGMFVLNTADGQTRYTRAGQFQFNNDGVFVNRTDGSKVMGVDADGKTEQISLAGLGVSSGQPTANVRLTGNLSSTAASQAVNSVTVFDATGAQHNLSLQFTNTGSTTPGSWSVALMDGSTTVGTAQIDFANGQPTAATSTLSFTYTPTGQAAQQLAFDFSTDVTSFASGNLSTLAVSSQDGLAPGAMTGATFDQTGTLIVTYTNGQTAKGARLLLGRFNSPDAVEEVGGNMFAAAGGMTWQTGMAGQGPFGSIQSGELEISNVDLSREFSDLIIMQRGYQASSQIISTANDMLQELFQLKGGR